MDEPDAAPQERKERERSPTGPRDAFLYLLSFVTLYLVAIGVLILAFGLINAWFPDPLRPGDANDAAVRYAIAQIVVALPVFLYVTSTIRRKQAAGDMPPGSRLAKVLTYFTLFVIAITAMIDLVFLIFRFLGGELTARFTFKALTVLVLVAVVFAYYRADLRSKAAG